MDPMSNGWAAIDRFGGIGDDLIAASVLPLLARKYKGVEVFTEDPNGVVFENNPYISKLTKKKLESLPYKGGVEMQPEEIRQPHEENILVNALATDGRATREETSGRGLGAHVVSARLPLAERRDD